MIFKRKYKSKKEEFEILYQTYADDIYRVCLYLAKDEKLAQDITVQTFFELYVCWEEVPPKDRFAYMVCMAESLVCEHHNQSEKD